jgi:hypothetical protein
MDSAKQAPSVLNPFQQRRLLLSFQHIDTLLAEVEGLLAPANEKALFPAYVPDLPASARQRLEEAISGVRARMREILAGENLASGAPEIAVSHAIQSRLSFAEVTLEDLRPRAMRGYGEVSEVGAAMLERLVKELRPILKEMSAMLATR